MKRTKVREMSLLDISQQNGFLLTSCWKVQKDKRSAHLLFLQQQLSFCTVLLVSYSTLPNIHPTFASQKYPILCFNQRFHILCFQRSQRSSKKCFASEIHSERIPIKVGEWITEVMKRILIYCRRGWPCAVITLPRSQRLAQILGRDSMRNCSNKVNSKKIQLVVCCKI